MLLSCDVDAIIGQHHEQKRDVEGHHRTGDGVGLVDHEDTVRRVGVLMGLPFLYLRVGGREEMRKREGKCGRKSKEEQGEGNEENQKKKDAKEAKRRNGKVERRGGKQEGKGRKNKEKGKKGGLSVQLSVFFISLEP